jgi:hypothetical protein
MVNAQVEGVCINATCRMTGVAKNYNFCRIHKTLRVTPAMEAGIADHVWSFEERIALLDRKALTTVA